MRELNFTVEGQKLSKSGDFSNIIRGTKGYLRCRFSINNEWYGRKVAAVFETRAGEFPAIVNGDRTCLVPDEVTDSPYFKLSLVGVTDKNKILTNKILISQEG